MMSYGHRSWRDWVLDESAARPIVRNAIEQGIIFFDTADVYSAGISEQITGRLLREFLPDREAYVLATKVRSPTGGGPNDLGLSRKHILAAVDASLRRLDADYVDLYQIHRWDPETPIEETMQALDDIVRAGKARYIGASSMYAWQFAKAQHVAERHGWAQFVSMQNHYNLLYREEEREMLPLCQDAGVGVLPWSPMARGLLTGTRLSQQPGTLRAASDDFAKELYGDANNEVIEALLRVAEESGLPPAQLALAWLLNKPGVTAPIIGATKLHHIDHAVAALGVKLNEQDVARLEERYMPQRVKGHG
jgi:aryl-alcohol dehydrogenase-like predicted oxidoreductase